MNIDSYAPIGQERSRKMPTLVPHPRSRHLQEKQVGRWKRAMKMDVLASK